MTAPARKSGTVITFYSFKGGTGRTMALANVAVLLARVSTERPVLATDWDFEAPGLHRFFRRRFQLAAKTPDVDAALNAPPGLLDLFLDVHTSTAPQPAADASDEDADAFVRQLALRDYCLPTDIPNLLVAKAGRFDESYATRVNGFSWQTFYERRPWFFRALARRFSNEFSYVLVDSRTGLTDTSGICTMLLPEKLVVVFTPGRQSLDGIAELITRATNYRRQSNDLRPLSVYPLASRIDKSELSRWQLWRNGGTEHGDTIRGYEPMFEEIFKHAYGLEQCELERYFHEISVQHYPAFAYGEQIAVLEEPSDDRLSLSRSYQQFTEYLTRPVNPWEDLQAAIEGERILTLIERAANFIDRGDPSRAEALLLEAIESHASAGLKDDPQIVKLLERVAEAFEKKDDFQGAARAQQASIALYERLFGREHPKLIPVLIRLADYERRRGAPRDALAPQRRALAIAEAAYGPDDEKLVDRIVKVAELLHELDEIPESQALFERARGIEAATDAAAQPAAGDAEAGAKARNLYLTASGHRIVPPETLWGGTIPTSPRGGPSSPSKVTRIIKNTEALMVDIVERCEFIDLTSSLGKQPVRIPLRDTYLPVRVSIVDTSERSSPHARQTDVTDRGVLFEDELRRHAACLVTGDPGSGKTTLLKAIALRFVLDGGRDFGMGPKLPFLVRLSAYAGPFADRLVPLDEFIAQDLATRVTGRDFGELLDTAMADGRALLLLDGLDEVQESVRGHLVAQIAHLRASFPKTILIVTSRTASKEVWQPLLNTFTHCQMLPVDDERVSQYVDCWSRALTGTDTPEAAQRARRLRADVMAALRRSRDLRILALNPLLLTGLILVLLNRGTLPTRRIELYESGVEIFLTNWFATITDASGSSTEGTRPAFDVADTVRMFAALALWMQEAGVLVASADQAQRIFAEVLRSRRGRAPDATAGIVLRNVAMRGNLLVERGPGEFVFAHAAFQEYLAAVAVAQRAQRSLDAAFEILKAHVDDERWRDVTTLAVAYIGVVQRRDEVAGDLVVDLASVISTRPGRSIVLAGEAVVEAAPDGVSPSARALAVEMLKAVMREENVAARERAEAGDALGKLGDPRFRADLYYLPDEPLLGFVKIAADSSYLMARYPVTVAQFQAFVEAADVKGVHADALLGPPNHPVVGVSWREARAYCEWLTHALRSSDKAAALAAALPNWRVKLPTEEQWERAARGGDDRLYPWGSEPDPDRANYFDTGLLRTTAVGTFPKGASVDGVEDLSGNVWEWTLSTFDAATQPQRLVLRGGAFSRGEQDIRTTSRNSDVAEARYDNLGFRVLICRQGATRS